MRGAVAFLISVAAMVTALSATFSTPALAAGRAHHTVAANRAAIRPASPRHFATPQPRAPASCETRGCRAASFTRPELVVIVVHVLPGHRYQATACAYEFASGPAVAGGDPVNESDPSGLRGGGGGPGPYCWAHPGQTIDFGGQPYQCSSQAGPPNLHSLACDLAGGLMSSCSNFVPTKLAECQEATGASATDCMIVQGDPLTPVAAQIDTAWLEAQGPCPSDWAIAGHSALAVVGLGSILASDGEDSPLVESLDDAAEDGTAAESAVGSTGRTEASNLTEQLAMQAAQADPAAGRVLPITMTDARWPASDGWVKMAQNISGVEIHYVYNTVTGASADFKFVP